MSLKEATAERHKLAETTPFMKAVFAGKISKDLWADFTYQKMLFYNGIEGVAGACGLTQDLPDIGRAHYLYRDYVNMTNGEHKHPYRKVAIDYYKYILNLYPDANKVMAHLYVWHMGDLFGGQMIKKIVHAPHESLDFKNPDSLKEKIRTKLSDDMADEANIAFDWAIKILGDFDVNGLE